MKISRVICRPETEDKLLGKHGVTLEEVEQLLFEAAHIRFIERGYRKRQNVYAAYGQPIEE